jgi:hypothetical protein
LISDDGAACPTASVLSAAHEDLGSHQSFPPGTSDANNCLALFFRTLPSYGALPVIATKFLASFRRASDLETRDQSPRFRVERK